MSGGREADDGRLRALSSRLFLDAQAARYPAAFHRAETARRWVWGAMALTVLLALLGLFGSGPLSRMERQGAGFRLVFERFERAMAPGRLAILLDGPQPQETVIGLAGSFVRAVRIDGITPQPLESAATADGLTLRVRAGQGSRVSIDFEPQQAGSMHGTLAVNGSAPTAFDQFVYP